jgi:uncharacterized protein
VRSFLILHGWQGSGPGHWQTWLAQRLHGNGQHVAYPDLPDADDPRLDTWLASLEGEMRALPGEPIVLCHSLSCLLWLHHVERGGTQAERLLLVAPPGEQPELVEFFPPPFPELTGEARMVCSDDDPYCPDGAAHLYGRRLGIPIDLLRGAGHINADSGYGAWPEVEAWCLGQRASVAGSGAKKGIET